MQSRNKARAQEREQRKSSTSPESPATSPTRKLHSPSKARSNRLLVRNALIHVCLAGKVNEKILQEVLEDLDDVPAEVTNFIVLLASPKVHTFRGLYSYDPVNNLVLKVYTDSQGPNNLQTSDVSEFLKYDSGSRTFKSISTCKTWSVNVNAVCILKKGGDKRKMFVK
jgi:hypothetical protein